MSALAIELTHAACAKGPRRLYIAMFRLLAGEVRSGAVLRCADTGDTWVARVPEWLGVDAWQPPDIPTLVLQTSDLAALLEKGYRLYEDA